MTKEILIIEDEKRIADLYRDYLHQAGFETTWMEDGGVANEWIKKNKPVLVILDLMLPDKDGMQICKEVRQFSDVPIIMVTARVEEIDRLLGLELGADDYICKPFSPREVVARVKAVLRRATSSEEKEDGSLLAFDEEQYKATLAGVRLDLTAVEFQLLRILASQPARIFSRDQLMEKLYDDGRIVYDRTIDSHIKKLRKKISQVNPEFELIHSVYGVGYKYEYAG